MSEVSKILERTRVEIMLDGIVYVVRKSTGLDMIHAYGSGALAMAEAADSPDAEMTAEKIIEGYDKMRAVCARCMVKPRLGDVSNAATDTVAWDDLGDHQQPIFNAIMGRTTEVVRDFPMLSEAQTE